MARLGGDEFCVVEKGVPQMLAGEWIRNLQEQLPTRLELACPTPLACQVSHGSAHFTRIADEFSSALHNADRALYRSKSARPAARLGRAGTLASTGAGGAAAAR